jgi:hypothetical protein
LGASKIWGPMQPHQSHSRPLGPKANFWRKNATHDDDVSKPYVDIGTFIPKAEFRATPSTRAWRRRASTFLDQTYCVSNRMHMCNVDVEGSKLAPRGREQVTRNVNQIRWFY